MLVINLFLIYFFNRKISKKISEFSDTDHSFFSQVFTTTKEKILQISEEKRRSHKYSEIQQVFICNIIKSIMSQYFEELSGFFRDKELNNENKETSLNNVCIGDDIEDKENIMPVSKVENDEVDDLSKEFLKLSI